jgi:hypothetical protein
MRFAGDAHGAADALEAEGMPAGAAIRKGDAGGGAEVVESHKVLSGDGGPAEGDLLLAGSHCSQLGRWFSLREGGAW